MRLVVRSERCQGHALCAGIAPQLFELSDEDGHSTAVEGNIPEDLQVIGRKAVMGCPENAIRIKF